MTPNPDPLKRASALERRHKAAQERVRDLATQRDAAIVEAVAAGWTYTDIAQRLGLAKQRIAQIARASRLAREENGS